MKGSPIKMGTIQGTAGHRSALKMKMEQDAAAKLKKESAMKMKMEAAAKMKKASAMKAKTYSQAYADMDDAEGGGKQDKYGRVYKDEASFTKAAKDYNTKTYGTENPTAESKKQNITKKQLAENTKNKKTQPKEDSGQKDSDSSGTIKKNKSNSLREILLDENKDGNMITRLFKKGKNKKKNTDDGGKKSKGFGPNKMKKESPAKKKTDREKLNKLVSKREKIRGNVKERDEKDTKFFHKTKDKIAAYRLKKIQKKINKNPEAIKDKNRADASTGLQAILRSPSKMKKGSAMKLNKGFDRLPKDVQAKIMKNKK